ncbi:hypothetical protein IWQ62_001515 [Dispira parvispora]|uniref:Cystinosin n=1 Tax=Dispira parvispora TaxID=1520584 RepID=A0A9W8E836_9FUNG|nr:hypothetical protein IWQ62_001515 [Dispira parvispora]
MVATFGAVVSAALGWLYFGAWSVSFYPQALLNYRRKSVQGLSIDFLVYNSFGFACYSLYNITFYASDTVRQQYRERNAGQENLVRFNDVMFAVHAFLVATFTLGQSLVYKRHRHQRLSLVAKTFLVCSGLGITTLLIGVTLGVTAWIDLMYFFSYVKLVVSLVKYCPQVYANYLAQSTVGWSIHNILLDFSGGILSMAQLLLDAGRLDNWDGVLGNPVKLGLALVSMAFDVVFMIQHYVLYRRNADFQRLDLIASETEDSEAETSTADSLEAPVAYNDSTDLSASPSILRRL